MWGGGRRFVDGVSERGGGSGVGYCCLLNMGYRRWIFGYDTMV